MYSHVYTVHRARERVIIGSSSPVNAKKFLQGELALADVCSSAVSEGSQGKKKKKKKKKKTTEDSVDDNLACGNDNSTSAADDKNGSSVGMSSDL